MKKKSRAIIVDDERLARKDMNSLLAEFTNIEVVGEADSVPAAAKLIKEKEPDIVFLDIQMPGESGFDLLEKTDVRAKVIFVTAFDEHAIRAFEVDAVDYLLKPVSPERLRKAIEKVEKEDVQRVGLKRPLTFDDTMFLTINTSLKFIKVSSILCVEAAGDYSQMITCEGKKGIVQKSMTEWEERLPENHFCRIHRSTIINLEHVIRIEEWFHSAYHVYLKGLETPLVMSRRYAARLKERMG
jgi:two-component system LytT family response regulator